MKSINNSVDFSTSVMWSLFNKKTGVIMKTNGKPVVLTSRGAARAVKAYETDYVIDKILVDIERAHTNA